MHYIIEDFVDLAKLEDGWLNGEGKVYDPALLKRGGEALSKASDIFGFPRLYIYPVADTPNTVSVEFDYANNGVILKFDLKTLTLEGFIISYIYKSTLDFKLDLTDIAEDDTIQT